EQEFHPLIFQAPNWRTPFLYCTAMSALCQYYAPVLYLIGSFYFTYFHHENRGRLSRQPLFA
ncbi:MAG: hypothetical protein ACI4SU_08115, partial [Anaerovoracaceae bacterium]